MAEYRDEKTAKDPIENNLDDVVFVDNHMKLAHEDLVPETQKDIDTHRAIDNLRDGKDVEAGTTARALRDERAESE